MDETGFSTVPTKAVRVLSLKGSKRVGNMTSQERGALVTMALAVNAARGSISPFYVFPTKKMQSVFLEQATIGAFAVANGSGWMQRFEFLKFMKHFIDFSHASKENPVLLLLDNHAFHLSIEILDMAIENGVTMLSFPHHCSHCLQPLDVSVYGPTKKFFASQHNS
ncbi:MFS-type transporter clz9-like [Leptopilina heterotoma]|uniref:MFS-type transporter clz9-like n=1 Tax=Leptopilina heterotoma TaxID=63436 RepID=UPI001CA9BE35|nr:MFS-type transporter clz9-like [Leptopilina heterotoma]